MAGRKYLISSMKKLEQVVKDNINVGPVIDKLRSSIEEMPDTSALAGLGGKIETLGRNLGKFDLLIQAQDDTRRSIDNLANNLMQLRPLLDGIHVSLDRQGQAIAGVNQGMSQLGELMGQILAKLG